MVISRERVASVVDYLRLHAEQQGNKVFVREDGKDLTFAVLFQRVGQLAGVLRQRLPYGERVVVVLQRYAEQMQAYLACLAAGLVPVQVRVSTPPAMVAALARESQANLILTDYEPSAFLPNTTGVMALPPWGDAAPFLWETKPHPIASVLFTTGTTGFPKGVLLSQQNLLAIMHNTLAFAGMHADDRELVTFHGSTTSGLNPINVHLMLGGQILFSSQRTNVEHLLHLFATQRITGYFSTPSVLSIMVENHAEDLARHAGQLNYLLVNSAPMPVSVTRRLLDLLPDTRVSMYYGMTEASRSVNIHYNANRDRLHCAGKASESVSVRIDNPDARGQGEISFKGPNVMMGYWNDAEATSAVLDDEGWLHSGDWGEIDDEGYVTVLGRVREQINVDGFKCQPREVEAVLESHPWVKRTAVAAVPDPIMFQVPGALIVPEPGAPADLLDQLQTYCRDALEAYKIPRYLKLVNAIPRNSMGKVKRGEVSALLVEASTA